MKDSVKDSVLYARIIASLLKRLKVDEILLTKEELNNAYGELNIIGSKEGLNITMIGKEDYLERFIKKHSSK